MFLNVKKVTNCKQLKGDKVKRWKGEKIANALAKGRKRGDYLYRTDVPFFNEWDTIGRIKGIKGLKNRNREIKKSFLKKK